MWVWTHATDRELLLHTLRRELANYMVRRDPDRFLRLYRKAREADIEIGKADKKLKEAEQTVITKKYPFYQDFDLVNVREHVLVLRCAGYELDSKRSRSTF